MCVVSESSSVSAPQLLGLLFHPLAFQFHAKKLKLQLRPSFNHRGLAPRWQLPVPSALSNGP